MALIDRIRRFAEDPNAATDMAEYGPFAAFKPISETRVATAEKRLSVAFPELLRELLTNVGNGGFGPGYGIIGIGKRGALDDMGQDLVTVNKMHRKGPKHCPIWSWPESRLTFGFHGCACYYCLDCSSQLYPVYLFDPSRIRREKADPITNAFSRESKSFKSWIETWLKRTRKRLQAEAR